MTGKNQFDVIIIGSGIGGLATASLLAQFCNYKVLLLEQHSKLGGYTHSFQRKKFSWDVGVHYMGGMNDGNVLRKVFDKVTGHQVTWHKYDDPSFELRISGKKYLVSTAKDKFFEDLKNWFPNESLLIDKYKQDIEEVEKWRLNRNIKKIFFNAGEIIHLNDLEGVEKFAYMLTNDYFKNLGISYELQSILDYQWSSYGQPGNKSLFYFHAVMMSHYFHGVYEPVGGSESLINSIKKLLMDYNAVVKTSCDVVEILIEEKKAYGVKVVDKKTGNVENYFAGKIISNVGSANTYLKLLSNLKFDFENEIKNQEIQSSSCISCFLGFKSDPRLLGIDKSFYIFYNDLNHQDNFKNLDEILLGNVSAGVFAIKSNIYKGSIQFTAQLMIPFNGIVFNKLLAEKEHLESYSQIKDKLKLVILEFLDAQFSGFSSNVEHVEIGTPKTFARYSGYSLGQAFGLSIDLETNESIWRQTKTPIENLYLTGADILGTGISNAVLSGVMCYSQIAGIKHARNFFK